MKVKEFGPITWGSYWDNRQVLSSADIAQIVGAAKTLAAMEDDNPEAARAQEIELAKKLIMGLSPDQQQELYKWMYNALECRMFKNG